MRIGMEVWGTRGDVRPFIALAVGLTRAGHAVTMAVASEDNIDYSTLEEKHGFKVRILTPKSVHISSNNGAIEFWKTPEHERHQAFSAFYNQIIEDLDRLAKELCAENDLVIGSQHTLPLVCAAEKNNIPYVSISNEHSLIETEKMPPPGYPDNGIESNRNYWKLIDKYANDAYLNEVNGFREQRGLPPVMNLLKEAIHSRFLNLVVVSSVFCHQQPDWYPRYRVTGFLDLDEENNPTELPGDLEAFLQKGSAPVFMTVGSMLFHEKSPFEITTILVNAAHQSGCRAIIQSRWESMEIENNEKIFKIKYDVPYNAILPKCCMMVHHGGAGTTHAAIYSGCPSVVIEYGFDQGLSGAILNYLGIAPAVLNRQTITSDILAASIKEVLERPEMKATAEKLSDVMRKENGVTTAVGLIEEYFEKYIENKNTH